MAGGGFLRRVLGGLVVLIAGSAGADEPKVTRLTVDLVWEHAPRTERGDSERRVLYKIARVPKAFVHFSKWRNGDRSFTIRFDGDDGPECSTLAERSSMVSLQCGTRRAYYSLIQAPGKESSLEWVTIESPKPPPAQVVLH